MAVIASLGRDGAAGRAAERAQSCKPSGEGIWEEASTAVPVPWRADGGPPGVRGAPFPEHDGAHERGGEGGWGLGECRMLT